MKFVLDGKIMTNAYLAYENRLSECPAFPWLHKLIAESLGKAVWERTKSLLTESSGGPEKPDGFVFPPPMSQCRKQGRAICKTLSTRKQTLKKVWVVLFIHRTTHRLLKKHWFIHGSSRQHTPDALRHKHHYSALIFSALSPSNHTSSV